MKQKREDYPKRWRQILLIRPYYRADGRTACVIVYVDGSSEEVYCRCEQVVTELADYFYTTVALARKLARRVLGEDKERKVPILLHEEFCLVPLKFREERQKNNSTIGYVVLRHVGRIYHHLSGTQIQFLDSHVQINIPQGRATVLKQLNRARRLQHGFQQEQEAHEREYPAKGDGKTGSIQW